MTPDRHKLFLPSDLSPALSIPSQEPISSVTFSKMSTDFVLVGQVPFYLRLILGKHELLTPHDFEHAKQKNKPVIDFVCKLFPLSCLGFDLVSFSKI